MANNSNLNTQSSSKQKPLLFGNAKLDASAIEDIERFEAEGFDHSYVPGYSEQRRMNELAVRDGRKPATLDKLYWARVARVDGANVDYREATVVSRLGYRACTIEDLEQRGWGMPPGAHVAADGLIRREDTALAIVDYDRASKNKKRQDAANAEFEGKDPMPEMPKGITGRSELETSGQGVSLSAAKQSLLANK